MHTISRVTIDGPVRLHKPGHVNISHHGAGIRRFPGTHRNPHRAIVCRHRLKELDPAFPDQAAVGVPAKQISQFSAVRVDPIKVGSVIPGLARVIPAAEQDITVPGHRRVKIMALVEGNLLNAAAVRFHYVQHERRPLTVFIQCRILGFALIQQYRPGTSLAGGRKNNPAVRQIGRCNVLPGFGNYVGLHDPPQ